MYPEMDHWVLGYAHLRVDHMPPKQFTNLPPPAAYEGLPTSSPVLALPRHSLFAKLMDGNGISFLFKFPFP